MIDIIICTLNRLDSLKKLLDDIKKQSNDINKIIIVDASDNKQINESIKNILKSFEKGVYIHSKRKNQPFQRRLGFEFGNSPYIVFFDDDIRIISNTLFKDIITFYQTQKIVGITGPIVFNHRGYKEVSEKLSYRVFKNGPLSVFKYLIWKITLNPPIEPGGIYFNGLTSPENPENGPTSVFKGPFMSFRREFLGKCLCDDIISFYELRLGKGEDKVMSMRMSAYGTLFFNSDLKVFHPENDSHYFNEPYSFNKRVSFSRLILSLEYAKLKGRSKMAAILAFYYFSVWRVMISFFSCLFSFKINEWKFLQGTINGVITASHFLLRPSKYIDK